MAGNRYYQSHGAKKRGVSTPGTGGGGYEITPDNIDRNREGHMRAVRAEQGRRERVRIRKTKPRAAPNSYKPWNDRPTNS